MSTLNFQTVRVVCLGSRVINNKRSTAFRLLGEGQTFAGPESRFSYIKNTVPAAIYTVEAHLVNGQLQNIKAHTMKFSEHFIDNEACAVIRLAHEAAESTLAALSQSRKHKADKSSILDQLKPLRALWRNTNEVGRLALEVRVLNYLRNGKDLD